METYVFTVTDSRMVPIGPLSQITRFVEQHDGVEVMSGKRTSLKNSPGCITERSYVLSEIEHEGAVLYEAFYTPEGTPISEVTLLGFRQESSVRQELQELLTEKIKLDYILMGKSYPLPNEYA